MFESEANLELFLLNLKIVFCLCILKYITTKPVIYLNLKARRKEI